MIQFIHIEVYAETLSAKAVNRRTTINSKGNQNSGTKSLLNVRQVIAEAKREVGACPHVTNPQTPLNVYGIDLDEVERMAVNSKDGQTDTKGRKLRNDTPLLLAGVTSYPRDEYEQYPENFEAWLNGAVDWLKGHYGDNLKNVTLHRDEHNPHIHFYAVSPDGRAKHLHAGYKAESIANAKDSKEKSLAYIEGMRQFQDSYYLEVSAKHGMLRDGPKKRRTSRAVYKAEKAHAQLLKTKINEINSMDQSVAEGIEQMYSEMITQAKKESELHAKSMLAESLNEANFKSNLMLEKVKLKIKEMLTTAQSEATRMRNEAIQWSENAVENMRRLATAEALTESLQVELEETRTQLDYIVAENHELKNKITTLNSKNN